MNNVVETSTTEVHPSLASLQPPTLPRIAIICVGDLTITRDGTPLMAWPNRKAREALAYLATSDGCQASRQAVQAALWPSVKERWAAQGMLRTTLWQVRQLLDRYGASGSWDTPAPADSVVMSKGQLLLLNPMRCTVDYRDTVARRASLLRSEWPNVQPSPVTLDAATAGELARQWLTIADDCTRPICAGETFPWLAPLNDRQREWRLDALAQARHFAEAADESALVAHALECRLRVEPLHEPTLAALFRLRLARGETAEVALQYRAFRQALARQPHAADDQTTVPSAEVEALYQAALGGSIMPRRAPAPRKAPTNDSAGDAAVDFGAPAYAPPARAPPHRSVTP